MPKVEFGADGIRGVVGEWPLILSTAVQIGQALGQFVCARSSHPSIVIGRDTRPSGVSLLYCLAAGLIGQGVDVINLGVMTTPGVAFLTRREPADLGVIVSASHSSLEYNGIKLVGPNGLRLQREEELEIENLIDGVIAKGVKFIGNPGQQIEGEHLIQLYIQDHVERCPAPSLDSLSVILDCANGAASRVALEAFRRLGAQVIAINDAIDGRSINYRCGSEYVREHPEELVSAMQQYGAAYGFAFDGDGDRLVVVDMDGRVYDGNDLLFLLARHYNSMGLLRGSVVVTTQLANGGLIEALSQAGIRTVFTSNGDKNLEAEMWGGDYLLGSEPGGNVIINDGHHTAADAVYAALVLGGVIVNNQPAGLADLVAPLCKRPQVTSTLYLLTTPVLEEKAESTILRIKAKLGDDSRMLHWNSTTEPGAFRVMVEGGCTNTQAEVDWVVQEICRVILIDIIGNTL